jgi:4-amino-4-deoxy-L-arabinose transferase-like glycosyltransferase
MMMPRVFAHAHFGALDTFTSCFWTLALLHVAHAVEARRPALATSAAGISWALALLTKIHAWLLPPVVLVWALVKLPWQRALGACAGWLAVGLALFVVGWPWLWYDPLARLAGYLNTGVSRAPIYVRYFHTVYADRDVPWHYPWFYFAVTVPIGLHLLGAAGTLQAWRARATDRLPFLFLGIIAMFLGLFSSRTPVYDGERLFLTVFPLWSVLIGRGFAVLWEITSSRRLVRLVLPVFLGCQAYGVVSTYPFNLSYYNLLVGGLPGAERLGLELTFWGDAVDDRLLDRLVREARPSETAALAPTLAPNQGVYATTSAMAATRPPLVLQDESAVPIVDWVVVYRRTPYWKSDVRELTRLPAVFRRECQGVWLSGIWRRERRGGVAKTRTLESFKPN